MKKKISFKQLTFEFPLFISLTNAAVTQLNHFIHVNTFKNVS